MMIPYDHPVLLRARRHRARWSEEDRRMYQRHRWRSKGFHGEAKTWHGLGRAMRWGMSDSPWPGRRGHCCAPPPTDPSVRD